VIVHFPSEGDEIAANAVAVPDAKNSCSTYPCAARAKDRVDKGSMM